MMTRRCLRPVLLGPVLLAILTGGSWPVFAEPLSFQVDNASVEQIVAGQQQRNYEPFAGILDPAALTDAGSSVVILQRGENNAAASHVRNSPGAGIATLQFGAQNNAIATIDNSPGSVIGQVQIGDGNTSIAAIVGGAGNTLATAQIGNGLGALVGLVNSQDTVVTYGQAGQNYNGGVVIKNAPPGTRIKIN
ncbi:hypothetical protein [Nitratireductor soli]|uniref:hypothetical protein n=1 Tax=Nitratireductor soli TaxID=1670619 RepID=UPI000AF1631A|nr:hypothetical protein [Nitratireductor soli]